MAAKPVRFVRDATGLVREFGLFTVIAIDLLGTSPWNGYTLASISIATLFPGANIYVVFVLGGILAVFNGLVYALLASAMPRSGGDYVYNGRILHPAIGFMSNWGLTWSQFVVLAFTAAAAITFSVANAFGVIGYITSSSGLISLATSFSVPLNVFIAGTIFLVATGILVFLPTRILGKIFAGGLVVLIVSYIPTMAVLFTANHDQFVQVFNTFLSRTANIPNGYNYIISTAANLGYAPGPWLLQSVLALPVAYFFYAGFNFSSYVGGEVKGAEKNQLRAVMIALLFSLVFYLATLGQLLNVIGSQFNESIAFLSANYPSKYPLPVMPSGNFFIGLLTGSNVPLNLMIQGSYFVSSCLIMPIAVITCVRNLFAWSFDRVIPSKFASVTEGGSPWVATIVTLATGEILLALYVLTSIFTLLINYIVIFSVAFLITGFAALVFPFRRKDLFDSSPAIVRKKIAGIPIISIAGIGNIILFVVIIYSSILLPAFSGPVGVESMSFVVGIYATGLIGYYLARAYRKREGIDILMLNRDLPPE
ncbi:MAG: APC family permease [Candidatus Bathyarchaeia archaeon]